MKLFKANICYFWAYVLLQRFHSPRFGLEPHRQKDENEERIILGRLQNTGGKFPHKLSKLLISQFFSAFSRRALNCIATSFTSEFTFAEIN